MSFKVATMCSGIGSPEQSIAELGVPHKIVFACEKDKFARQTYLANFTPGIMYEDMTTESWDLPEQYADLIVAGIPCQSFSLAGKRKGENDPRGLLIYDFIRYVKNQRPKVFIVENVKGLLSDMGGVTFSKWCELLGANKNGQAGLFTNNASCGYNLHYRVLNAKHYGLPQNRERVFIIGIRPDLPICAFRWPKPVVLKDRLIDLLEAVVDEKYYLSDEMMNYINNRKDNFNGGKINYKTGNDIASCLNKNSHSIDVSDNLIIERIAGFRENENIISAYQGDKKRSTASEHVYHKQNGIMNNLSTTHKPKVILKENYIQWDISGKGYNSQQDRAVYANGNIGSIPSTRTENKVNVLLINSRIRRLTPLECMRLMGYPDSFVKPCSETQTYKQAGNSIPVHMMKAILKQLLPILTS